MTNAMTKVIVFFLPVFLLGEAHPNPPTPPSTKDDECRPDPPNASNSAVCCTDVPDMFDVATNSSLTKVFEACRSEVGPLGPPPTGEGPMGPPPSGEGPMGPPPSGEGPMGPPPDFDCISECLFKHLNLLDAQNKLDQGVIKKLVLTTHTGEWAAVATKAIDTCFSTSTAQIPKESKCKSGAEELMNCYTRIMFLNCPSSKWISNETCTKLKERVEKCPNFDTIPLM